MATYIKYQMEDGTTILVETTESKVGGVAPAGRDKIGNIIVSVNQKFEDAFLSVKKSAAVLRQQLEELRADEVEVTFGLKATGELGNFAIGQIGVEANYMVKLKWQNQQAENERG